MVDMESLTTQKTRSHPGEARVLVVSGNTGCFTGTWILLITHPFPGLLLVVSFNNQSLGGTEWEQFRLQHMLPPCGVTIGIHLFPTPSISGYLLTKRNLGSPTFSHSPETKNLGRSERLVFQKHKSWFFPRAFQ